MKERKIFFLSPEIKLEGLIVTYEALSTRGGVILCHPHPQYGGDMDNSVILSGVDAASEAGYSTLRFNFRGDLPPIRGFGGEATLIQWHSRMQGYTSGFLGPLITS